MVEVLEFHEVRSLFWNHLHSRALILFEQYGEAGRKIRCKSNYNLVIFGAVGRSLSPDVDLAPRDS